MRDPERLINDGATDFERLLVDGAANERPSPELGGRMVAGLERVLGSRTTAAATTWSIPWMWLGALAVVASGLTAAAWITLRRDAPPATQAIVEAPAVPPAPPALAMPDQTGNRAEPRAGDVAPPARPQPDPGVELGAPRDSSPQTHADARAHGARTAKVAAPDSPAANATPAANAAPAANAGGDLREEMRLIQRARAGVREHNAARALAELRDYAARFPNGTFAPEAAVLRVEALELDGQHAQAVAQGRRFLSAHADSPLADRVERIAGPGASKSP